MTKIEYKKINYIFSINNCVEDSVKKLSLTEESLLYICKLVKYYNSNLKNQMKNSKLTIIDKKRILEDFLEIIPNELMILRNHIKNCLYVNTQSDLAFRYKHIEEDFKRLNYI